MIPAVLSLLAYVASAAAAYRNRTPLVLGAGATAVALHAWVLFGDLFHASGLQLGLFDAASLVLCLAAMLILLCARLMPVAALALIAFPIAGAMAVIAAASGDAPGDGIAGWPLQLHVGLSVLAAGLFTLAALQSLLVAAQNRFLHGAREGSRLPALPALQSMESALFGALWLAWSLLTASLLTGILFVDDLLGQHLVHKTVLSAISWAVFGMLLWGHWRYGWRGRTALRWTWSGYAVLLLAYFGSKFVLENLLGLSWG